MADIISMQNWDHLAHIFDKLNWRPKLKRKTDLADVDFSRLRHCYVNNHASYFRQNIMISSYMTPNMKRLFNDTDRSFCNVFGRIKIRPTYNGILDSIIPMIKQYFRRFDVTEATKMFLNKNKKDDIDEMLNLVFESDSDDDNDNGGNNSDINEMENEYLAKNQSRQDRFKQLRKYHKKIEKAKKKNKKNKNKNNDGNSNDLLLNGENMSEELMHLHEARFFMYKEYILPIFRKMKLKTLIFVASYFDFLRLRRLYRNVDTIRFVSELSICLCI